MKLPAKVAAIQLEGDSVRIAVVNTGGKKPTLLEQHEVRAEYADIDKRHDAIVVAVRDAVLRRQLLFETLPGASAAVAVAAVATRLVA